MGLKAHVIKSLLLTIPKFFLISIIIFTLVNLGDPPARTLENNPDTDTEIRNRLIDELGLERPFLIRYFIWIGSLFRGDLGYSCKYLQPVINLVGYRLSRTLELLLLSQVIATFFAIVLGVFSAVKQHSLADSSTKAIALIGYSAPNFWLALMCIIVFAGMLS